MRAAIRGVLQVLAYPGQPIQTVIVSLGQRRAVLVVDIRDRLPRVGRLDPHGRVGHVQANLLILTRQFDHSLRLLRSKQTGLADLAVDVDPRHALVQRRPERDERPSRAVVGHSHTLPVRRKRDRLDDVPLAAPLGQDLAGEHVPVAFKERTAFLQWQALQRLDVAGVRLQESRIVVDRREMETPRAELLALVVHDEPRRAGARPVLKEPLLDPSVADAARVERGADVRLDLAD